VKIQFPILECSKLMKLDSTRVDYNTLFKILNKSKISDEMIKSHILFTEQGTPILSGDSLIPHQIKDKDTLVFKRRETPKEGSWDWDSVCSMLGNFLKRPSAEELVAIKILSPAQSNEFEPLSLNVDIIARCLLYLSNKKAYDVEGLFRISGPKHDVKLVYDTLKSDAEADLEWILNPHTVATVLKHYVRFLSPPLIPYKISSEIAFSISAGKRDITQIAALLQPLPSPNIQALHILVQFFNKMLELQHENKMSLQNIAIVWGPNLLAIDSPDMDIFMQPLVQSTFATMLITHFREVFPKV